jgi:ABC-type antimicrobial peptide transport system permease subunit
MNVNAFDILMVVAIGSLAGAGIGILIAYVAGKQKNRWSAMSRKEQAINSVLIIIFCAICCGGLGYYFLM